MSIACVKQGVIPKILALCKDYDCLVLYPMIHAACSPSSVTPEIVASRENP